PPTLPQRAAARARTLLLRRGIRAWGSQAPLGERALRGWYARAPARAGRRRRFDCPASAGWAGAFAAPVQRSVLARRLSPHQLVYRPRSSDSLTPAAGL